MLWYINKIRPDITVCVKIDQNGKFTWRPATVCRQVLLAGWIMEWKKKKVSNESWRQTSNARVFTECFSGSVVCLRIKQQKANNPDLFYNMRTFPNLVRATPYISHAYVCSILLSSTYVLTAQGETLDCYSVACRVHYTTYTPIPQII